MTPLVAKMVQVALRAQPTYGKMGHFYPELKAVIDALPDTSRMNRLFDEQRELIKQAEREALDYLKRHNIKDTP